MPPESLDSHNTPSSTSKLNTLSLILGEAIEICVYELLYHRGVYPRESFAPTRYMGIRCHVCRHPDVANYVAETLGIAIPALSRGAADCVSLVVIDGSKRGFEEVLERYCFEFDALKTALATEDWTNEIQSSPGKMAKVSKELEFGLKQLILRLISLDGTRMGDPLPSSATFKICLRLSSQQDNEFLEGRGCEELSCALREGKWFRPDEESCELGKNVARGNTSDSHGSSADILTRPLKSVRIPSCGFSIQLLMEVKK